MKFYLRNIGFTLTVIAIVLALFDFLLENNLVIFDTMVSGNSSIKNY